MNRRRALGQLAGVAALAGCLRLASGDAEESSTGAPPTTSTRTPTGTPTDSSTDSPTPVDRDPEYPLGLSESGVTKTLLATHRETLEDASFRSNVKKIDVDGGFIWRNRTYRYAGDAALGTLSHEGPITIYRDADTDVWREHLGGEYTYGRDEAGEYFGKVIDSGVMDSHFEAGDWGEPTVVRAAFPGRFELATSRAENPAEVTKWHGDVELQSFEGTMVVDERGFVRSLDTRRTYVEDGSEEVQRYVFSVSDLGDVSVERPAWIETAERRTPTATASFVEDRTMVRLDHESGNALEPETGLQPEAGVHNPVGNVRLSEAVEAGDTVFVYQTADGDVDYSIGSRPTAGAPERLPDELYLRVQRGGLKYFDLLEIS